MSILLARAVPWLGGGALLTIAGFGIALSLKSGQLADARKDLAIEQAVHETDNANFKAAQALADSMWLTQLDGLKSTYRSIKDDTDRQTDNVLSDYRALVRMLPAAPARTTAGGSQERDVPSAGLAEGVKGPGGDSVLLARADVDICAINTGRLEQSRGWAMKLEAISSFPNADK